MDIISITRDHTQFFLVSFLSVGLSTSFLKFFPDFRAMAIPITTCLNCIMCCRIVLSLRKEAHNHLTVYNSNGMVSTRGGIGDDDGERKVPGSTASRVLRTIQDFIDPPSRSSQTRQESRGYFSSTGAARRGNDGTGGAGSAVQSNVGQAQSIRLDVVRIVREEGPDDERDPDSKSTSSHLNLAAEKVGNGL